MSQINSSSSQLAVDSRSNPEPLQAASKAMPQARSDFDAALQRADQSDTDDEDQQTDELDQPNQIDPSVNPFGVLVPMPPSAMTAQVTSADQALGGGGTVPVLPNTHGGTLPDAVPMTAGAISADQQWRINIPVNNDPSSSALAVRLANSGTGHWQVRLAADGPTRRQLAPSLGRLRDKLRRHSGNQIDDLEFDDDTGSESDAGT